MARTLLKQILEQNPHTLDYFYSKCCDSIGVLLTSRIILEKLLAVALGNCESTYIVLDGLDECCSRKERGDIVKWFRDTVENLPPEERDRIRCLFVSQNDSARKDYRDFTSITLDSGNNEDDIEAYGEVRSKTLVEKLGISEQEASKIAANVAASAEGKLTVKGKDAVVVTSVFVRHFSLCAPSLDQFMRPKLDSQPESRGGVSSDRP
jgi:hypothetical protein